MLRNSYDWGSILRRNSHSCCLFLIIMGSNEIDINVNNCRSTAGNDEWKGEGMKLSRPRNDSTEYRILPPHFVLFTRNPAQKHLSSQIDNWGWGLRRNGWRRIGKVHYCPNVVSPGTASELFLSLRHYCEAEKSLLRLLSSYLRRDALPPKSM